MGSGIACHFANIGVNVLLLDIVPRELNDAEKAKGLTLESKSVRNRLVNDSLTTALKSKPAPLYHEKFASRITTGNLEDDISKVAEADWIIDMGPEGGQGGGRIVAQGPPGVVVKRKRSHTGRYLGELLGG